MLVFFMLTQSNALFAQGAPISGDALISLGETSTAEMGAMVVVPVNIDLSGVSAVDIDTLSVPAVLGNYRIVINYDNTLVKARNVVPGGSTLEFSGSTNAHITTSGTVDSLTIMQTQLSSVSPTGLTNVAQIEFDILTVTPVLAALNITVLDLRTPIIFTGNESQPVIGGEDISTLITNGNINIVAPTLIDSDNDGMPDDWELANGLNPGNAADALLDSDGDGLNNLGEYLNNTGIQNPDSDNDLVPDGAEVDAGTNPNDILDFPLWITSVSATVNALELNTYQYTVIANKSGATFSLDLSPIGMTIDAATGVINWVPALNQLGNFNITVRATAGVEFATQTFVLNVIELGDVNASGEVNAADILLVQRHVLEIAVLDTQQIERADMYPPAGGDGQVTISDLLLITRKVMGN